MNQEEGFKKLKTLAGWKQFFKILTKKERILFFSSLTIFLIGNFWFWGLFYFKNTKEIPASGGVLIEGVVGQPRFLNPIYGMLSDIDRDINQLIFASLMRYNEKGELVPDLLKEYKILENGKIFEITLKDNLFWEDGKEITADDVTFTLETIQNPDFKSPLRALWVGVSVEKISEKKLLFKLKEPSVVFLENLTLQILPRHIWQDISAENFPFSIYNLQPITSGPYRIAEINQEKEGYIKSLTLLRNNKYHGEKPKIEKIIFRFFKNEEDLIKAAQKGEIKSFSILNPENYQRINSFKSFKEYRFFLPRYFAVFFNPEKSKLFADKKIREALNYGTNKEEIVKIVLAERGRVNHSPILPEIYGFKAPEKNYDFDKKKAEDILREAGFSKNELGFLERTNQDKDNFQFKSELKIGSRGKEVAELQKCLAQDREVYPEGEISSFFGQRTKEAVIRFQEKYAKDILEPQGLKKGNGIVKKATRDKLNELCANSKEKTIALKISLTVPKDPLLEKTAETLKNQWQALGIETTIELFDPTGKEKEKIKERDYQALLFGEVLSSLPDPLPFWHSLQKRYPGSNLALYENKKSDKILEETRKIFDPQERAKKLEEFQNILIADAPAIFLFSQDYVYFTSKEIKGIREGLIVDPAKRFSNIESWYIKTKRIWKK